MPRHPVTRPHLDRLIGHARTGVAAIGRAQEIQRLFTGATYHSESEGGARCGAVRLANRPAGDRVPGTLPALVGAARRFSVLVDDSPPAEIGPEGQTAAEAQARAREAATELLGLAKRASLSQKWWVTSRG